MVLYLFLSFLLSAEGSVDEKSLRTEMESFIAIAKPNRSVGQTGHKAAYEYLKVELQKLGGAIYEHHFSPDVDFAIKNYKNDFATMVEGKITRDKPDYKKWKDFTDYSVSFVEKYRGKTGRNLVLEFKGKTLPNEVVYVGAHFDTITHDHTTLRFTPDVATDGADDNASGVAALLAIAKELAKRTNDRTLRFVAFDYEEVFFLGSYALAKDLKEGKLAWASKSETTAGLFNLEMLGFSQKKDKPEMKLYTRSHNEKGVSQDMLLAKRFEDAAKHLKSKVQPIILQNGFNRSDNWSFWQNDLPAVCVTQDWEADFNEKNYHTNHDSIANLNFSYLAEITRLTVEVVRQSLQK